MKKKIIDTLDKISIHALVKRATRFRNKTPKNHHYFNPRPRKEGDMVVGVIRAERLYFNPRPRKEGDFDVSFNASYIERISIHALVKRATSKYTYRPSSKNISIHALVKRATLYNV